MNPDFPDLVATWTIPLPHGVQVIEFEHGETTGKRVIRVNGEEVSTFTDDSVQSVIVIRGSMYLN